MFPGAADAVMGAAGGTGSGGEIVRGLGGEVERALRGKIARNTPVSVA